MIAGALTIKCYELKRTYLKVAEFYSHGADLAGERIAKSFAWHILFIILIQFKLRLNFIFSGPRKKVSTLAVCVSSDFKLQNNHILDKLLVT